MRLKDLDISCQLKNKKNNHTVGPKCSRCERRSNAVPRLASSILRVFHPTFPFFPLSLCLSCTHRLSLPSLNLGRRRRRNGSPLPQASTSLVQDSSLAGGTRSSYFFRCQLAFDKSCLCHIFSFFLVFRFFFCIMNPILFRSCDFIAQSVLPTVKSFLLYFFLITNPIGFRLYADCCPNCWIFQVRSVRLISQGIVEQQRG